MLSKIKFKFGFCQFKFFNSGKGNIKGKPYQVCP